tara:strand:+ start:715 stop:2139 length:1425 start_codon:yes stop_codon:yes gene_type:complete
MTSLSFLSPVKQFLAAMVAATILTACTQSDTADFAANVTETDWADEPYSVILSRVDNVPDFREALESGKKIRSANEQTVIGLAKVYGWRIEQDVSAGLAMLEKACDRDQMRACQSIGWVIAQQNNPQSVSRRMGYHSRACEGGIVLACAGLTEAYANGHGTEKSVEKALAYADISCRDMSTRGCANAASYLIAVLPDQAEAKLKQACDVDNIPACENLGLALLKGVYGEDRVAEAAKPYERGCLASSAQSCTQLVNGMITDKLTPADANSVLLMSETLCRSGATETCLQVAYHFGRAGAAPHPARSFRAANAGCNQGDATMCRWVAEDHRDGVGTPKNLEKAQSLYAWLCESGELVDCQDAAELKLLLTSAKAPEETGTTICDFGDAEACRTLAWEYATGDKRAQDTARATELFLTGCDKGNANSCIDLGSLNDWAMFGVAEDKEAARELYVRACDMGSKVGCDLLDQSLSAAR